MKKLFACLLALCLTVCIAQGVLAENATSKGVPAEGLFDQFIAFLARIQDPILLKLGIVSENSKMPPVGRLFLLFFFLAIVIAILNGVINCFMPKKSCKAYLEKKRYTTMRNSNGGMNTFYHCDFRLEDGRKKSFTVSAKTYYSLNDDRTGVLFYRGTRFLQFHVL